MKAEKLPVKKILFLLEELDYDIDNAKERVAKSKTVLESNRQRAKLTCYQGMQKRLEKALDEKQKK